MPDLYVIVHEAAVDFSIEYLSGGERAAALRVKKELSSIRYCCNPIEIDCDKLPYASAQPPDGLPPTSDGLTIVLAGAYRSMCVTSQQLALEKAGYSVRVHEPGCLD